MRVVLLFVVLAVSAAFRKSSVQKSVSARKCSSLKADAMAAINREDFPILDQVPYPGKKLVYLDSAASSQKPTYVIDAMNDYYMTTHSNVHRGAHALAAKATTRYEWSRDMVKEFINAKKREEIIFTRGATEAINLVALSWGRANLKPGDEVILSVMEHHSNIVPWQMVAKETGAVLKYVHLDENQELDMNQYRALLSGGTGTVDKENEKAQSQAEADIGRNGVGGNMPSPGPGTAAFGESVGASRARAREAAEASMNGKDEGGTSTPSSTATTAPAGAPVNGVSAEEIAQILANARNLLGPEGSNVYSTGVPDGGALGGGGSTAALAAAAQKMGGMGGTELPSNQFQPPGTGTSGSGSGGVNNALAGVGESVGAARQRERQRQLIQLQAASGDAGDDATSTGTDNVNSAKPINKIKGKSRVKMVALQHASNVLSTTNPVDEIVELAHKVGALVLLDACQSVPHMPVDVQEIGCDFLVASAHKMCGPTGVGFLYGKTELLTAMPPLFGGGEMIDRVGLQESTYALPPSRFEAGTPAICEAIGMGAACEYLNKIGMENVLKHEKELGGYLYEQLDLIKEEAGLTLYGPTDVSKRNGLVAFNCNKVHATDLSFFLDQEGIAVRTGHHCTQPLHDELGAAGSVRASLYFYNSKEDVDSFIGKLKDVLKMFENMETVDAEAKSIF